MTTTLQKWGNSQGIRLPKALLSALRLENGAPLELEITPERDAIILKPVRRARTARGHVKLEELVAKMPRRHKAAEFNWGREGREVW